MNLLVATSLLKATKIQVDTAISGMSALKKLSEKPYDIIFLDQMMPSLDGIQTLKLAKSMENNKSKNVPMIALTANAISGAKEMFLKEGFTDYLSKPIDARAFEEMLMTYLPPEKIHSPIKNEGSEINNDNEQETNQQNNYEYLNVELGLQYSAGMEDMYKNILTMFCNLKDEKKSKMQEAFDNEDWKNYTTFVHALKSTSLSIGSEKMSEAAKKLEMSGKILISGNTSELEKYESEDYIKSHHAEVMEIYDKLVEEGKSYLKEDIEETQVNNEQSLTTDEYDEQQDSDVIKNLQEAFENEDWVMYSILIQEIKGNEALVKQIDMACKMINADFTTDKEKQEAIKFIKENHSKLIE